MTIRALYIPHGGGPMPLLGDPGHSEMIAYLGSIEASIGRPSAIVVVSAHWESHRPAITANPNPGLLFDYYGFPAETYQYAYPAPGSVELAQQLHAAMDANGLDPVLDPARAFDHGVFVPLMLMYPDAGIPIVQVSLIDGLDPATHLALGEAIGAALDANDDEILVLGSGMSFHNLRAFHVADDPGNQAFDKWLEETCTGEMTEDDRRRVLSDWTSAPSARHNHPREEHLMPLHVCYGTARSAATRTFDGLVGPKRVAAYGWN